MQNRYKGCRILHVTDNRYINAITYCLALYDAKTKIKVFGFKNAELV